MDGAEAAFRSLVGSPAAKIFLSEVIKVAILVKLFGDK